MYKNLIQNDLKHIWHPCSFMPDFKEHPPLVILDAKGSYINTNKGKKIDAISSWWCKSLGHGHPKVISAIKNQLDKFEHVITANTTNSLIVELALKLTEISKKQHVFFASDGASAVEIALKLAMHANKLKGNTKRKNFISLQNSYHGETFATMNISDLAIYKKPYETGMLNTNFLHSIPYVSDVTSATWNDCSSKWPDILKQLELIKDETIAIIVEPIVQGASGMLCYSQDFLKKLGEFAKKNDIYLIADEIMTGLGRTGKWLAVEHAGISPDIICLSKGLTSGSIPLSLVLIDHEIFELFYKDKNIENAFLHSHTYSGNPLAISAALATINTMHEENTIFQAELLGNVMRDKFKKIMSESKKLSNMRSIGAIVAADLNPVDNMPVAEMVKNKAEELGAILRPINNTLYWLPPLNTKHDTISDLAEITFNAIQHVYKNIY
jgi:adenosylmethionine-8-amino-7-oxononanoate aminotransferase